MRMTSRYVAALTLTWILSLGLVATPVWAMPPKYDPVRHGLLLFDNLGHQDVERREAEYRNAVRAAVERTRRYRDGKTNELKSLSDNEIEFITDCWIASTYVYPFNLRMNYMEWFVDNGGVAAAELFEAYHAEQVKIGAMTAQTVQTMTKRRSMLYDACRFAAQTKPEALN